MEKDECTIEERLQAKTVSTQQWQDKHGPHSKDFGVIPFNHPSGNWYWLVCACGARHLTSDTYVMPVDK